MKDVLDCIGGYSTHICSIMYIIMHIVSSCVWLVFENAALYGMCTVGMVDFQGTMHSSFQM